MLFKITYAQFKTFLLTTLTLLAVWLFMGHYARFTVTGDGAAGKLMVNISFLAPMNKEKAVQRLMVTGGVPGRQVEYSAHWISRNTVQVIIDESAYPRGLDYNVSFRKAPALIPPFTVSVDKKISFSLAPQVVALEPASDVPTAGPLVLVFNTPVDPQSFAAHVSTNAPGAFSPREVKSGGKLFTRDYSRWLLTPAGRFANNTRYGITVSPGLRGTGGGIAGSGRKLTFNTAPALIITDIYPLPFSPSVWLSRNITATASQDLREAAIKVEGVAGATSLKEKTVVFDPDGIFLPNHKYNVSIDLVARCGESLHKEFSFSTTNLGGQRWIGVKAGNPCAIDIYEGDRLLKSCQGWPSIADSKIPRVTMYETKRGSSAEYLPDNPSPIQYLHLNADIMLHYTRPGEEHNHQINGLPPSYGCILLNREDMDWILNNVPGKCMVIVH